MSSSKLTHLDAVGDAHMVDVGAKQGTAREAVARAVLKVRPSTLDAIEDGDLPKGDILAVARVAGIMAAKRTAEIIPLCHPIALSYAGVKLSPKRADGESLIEIEATVRNHGKTGVEMEALTAATAAALTVYDMCKAIDREMVISDVYLAKKHGGRSGDFHHPRANS